MTRRIRVRSRYSDENDVTLFHGDCLALLKQIPRSTAQAIVTSPPYNVGKAYEKRVALDEYLAFQRRVIAESMRILRPGGSICWQVGNFIRRAGESVPIDTLLHPLFSEYAESEDLRLRNRIVWHFEHGLHCRSRFSGRYETILWYTKGAEYKFRLDRVRVPQKYPGKLAYKGPARGKPSGNPLGKNPGDVWIFPNVKSNHPEKTSHPCQFPVELPERLILALTDPGDLVVDPFLGVGSTAVAAILHGRRVAGADIVSDYLNVARKRVLDAARGTVRLRPLGRPVFMPPPNARLTAPPDHFKYVPRIAAPMP